MMDLWPFSETKLRTKFDIIKKNEILDYKIYANFAKEIL